MLASAQKEVDKKHNLVSLEILATPFIIHSPFRDRLPLTNCALGFCSFFLASELGTFSKVSKELYHKFSPTWCKDLGQQIASTVNALKVHVLHCGFYSVTVAKALISQNIRSMAPGGKHMHRKTCACTWQTLAYDLPDVFVTGQLSSGAFQVRFRVGVTHRLCLCCISPPIQRLFQGKQVAIQVMSCAAAGLARELQSSLPSSESRNQT